MTQVTSFACLVTLSWTQNSIYSFRKSALDSSTQGDLGWSMLKKCCWEVCMWLCGCTAEGSTKPCSMAFVGPGFPKKPPSNSQLQVCSENSNVPLADNAEMQFLFQPTASPYFSVSHSPVHIQVLLSLSPRTWGRMPFRSHLRDFHSLSNKKFTMILNHQHFSADTHRLEGRGWSGLERRCRWKPRLE